MRDALAVEEAPEEIGRFSRVARRIAGVDAGEGAQELELALALVVEPADQPLADAHGRLNCGAGASCTTTPSLTTPRPGAPPIPSATPRASSLSPTATPPPRPT